MPRTFRIAVLECDTVIDTIKATRGLYGDIFRDLITRGVTSIKDTDANFEVSSWDVVKGIFPAADDFDGLLLSGSRHTAFENDPWILKLVEYLQDIFKSTEKPVVGICFGHQIIARALGAKVGVSPGGWEISVENINLNGEGQKLLGVPSLNLHQMHRDAVLEVPKDCISIGSSPRCSIQGLYRPGKILTVQAHPEFDGFIMTNILNFRRGVVFDEDMYKEGMSRAEDSHDGVIECFSPSTREIIFKHDGVSVDEARVLVDRSHEAFKTYRKTSLAERKAIMTKALDYLTSQEDVLAKELTSQMGRPISAAASELRTMRKRAEYFLETAEEALSNIPGKVEDGFERWVSRVPIGPVFISSAWNFPWLITINTLAPALLAGDTVLLKPSPQTPLVGDRLKEAFDHAGLPKDVLQILHLGGRHELQAVVQFPKIRQVCFTGSTGGGLAIRRATADRVVPVNLELGGNDPAYVRADADIAWTAGNIVDGAIFNSGQSCCGLERVYVHESIHDEFVAALQKELASYTLGDPFDKSTNVGPVVSPRAAQEIEAQVTDALNKGAVDATPPNASFASPPNTGTYVAPRLLINVNHDMQVMRDETFGPLLPVMKVRDDAEAVELMNDSNFGLTASIWTKDVDVARGLQDEVEAGTVFINRCDFPSPDLSWIGWKDSGLGSTLGPRGFDGFTTLKSHHIRLKQG
ncbi:Aldehyde/histidinol dehydrogenase [Plectosphaerella plurivora]|uniref:aldehyde dehydrogenase (NAD(+)) n=1 Tax=Plectosphaerella plurivora TaxID=936078 RepID=A0A9P8VK13_9PEZI|nr:Aldehyde/histidinol dehydrogenase [Plectosphaerella plurivora]